MIGVPEFYPWVVAPVWGVLSKRPLRDVAFDVWARNMGLYPFVLGVVGDKKYGPVFR